jgi:hypothetical protein
LLYKKIRVTIVYGTEKRGLESPLEIRGFGVYSIKKQRSAEHIHKYAECSKRSEQLFSNFSSPCFRVKILYITMDEGRKG